MTQKIMMVVEQPRPVVMQTTEFVRGGGSSDYDALINKPAINGVTLEGDKTASELALATPSDVAAKYTKPSGGIPKADLASAVQTSLNKANTALQTAPVTSVNGQTGVVNIAVPSTAADVGAVAANQGSENAGKFLAVANDGSVQPTAISTWQAGDY